MYDTPYRIFFLLHIASVVVAFAPVVLAVVPGGGAAGDALRAAGRTVYGPALIAAGLFGLILVMLSDELWEFSQAWVSLAFLVWFVMVGVFQGLVMPGKRLGGGRRPRAGAVDVQSGEAILTLLFLVMLYLMIWKPGGPF